MKALLAKQKMINKVILIPEYKIKPNPYQPRKVFDDEKIDQLATSIAQYGLLQPITVLPMEDGNYQLVAGERRLLACRKLRMQEVPAILTSMDEERSSALALIENIQRCDLNYFEEAMAIQKLMKMVGHTQQAVAKKLGKNQSTIANKLRLLQFSEEVREAILAANLTERHARALLNLNEQGDEVLLKAVKEISEKEMNVSQTEKYIAQLIGKKEEKPKKKELFVVKDLKIFFNTIDKALETMKLSGIEAKTQMQEEEDEVGVSSSFAAVFIYFNVAFLFNVRYRNIAIGNAGKICFTGKEFIQSKIFAGLIQIKFGIKAEFWKLEIYISIFYRFAVLLRKNFFHAFLIEQRFQRVTLFWKDKVHGLTVHKWNLKHGVVIGFIIRTAFKFLVHIGYINLFPVSKGKFSGCVVFCFKVVCPCTFKIESVDDGEYLI